jgi:hypothetical protein
MVLLISSLPNNKNTVPIINILSDVMPMVYASLIVCLLLDMILKASSFHFNFLNYFVFVFFRLITRNADHYQSHNDCYPADMSQYRLV